MSRSVYIWYVQNSDGNVIAAFTVKHELATWLDRRYGPAEFRNAAACPVLLYRIRDGHIDPDARPVAHNPRTLEPVT